MNIKTLHNGMSVNGINDLKTSLTLYDEFFVKNTYDWWYKVQPGDIVMDIGACNGMFTCKALDQGAAKVYAVEPNPILIETIFHNAMPHIVNKKTSPLSVTNAFVGGNIENGFGDFDKGSVPMLSFKELIKHLEIQYLDYLKVDCEGGEFNMFNEENWDFLSNNVKHIAMEVHLDASPSAPDMFIKMREKLLPKLQQAGFQLNFLKPEHKTKMWNDSWIKGKWPIGWGSCWMIYLTKK